MTAAEGKGRAWFREEALRRRHEAEQAAHDRTLRGLSFLARRTAEPPPVQPARRRADPRREADARWAEITRDDTAPPGSAATTPRPSAGTVPFPHASGASERAQGAARPVSAEETLAIARRLDCPISPARAREIALAANHLARERGLSPRIVVERALAEFLRTGGPAARG
jgi:hypothetical protein